MRHRKGMKVSETYALKSEDLKRLEDYQALLAKPDAYDAGEVTVLAEGHITPYFPARTYGGPDGVGYPPEGGEVENLTVTDATGEDITDALTADALTRFEIALSEAAIDQAYDNAYDNEGEDS